MTPGRSTADQQRELCLLLDLGSSRSKWLLLAAGQQLADADLCAGTVAELRADLQARLAAGWRMHSAVGICVASADQRNTISAMLRAEFALSVQWLRTRARVGDLLCGYPDPQQLGVDRWAGLAGARALYPREHVVVADCGTATTVDFLRADGQHQGGWISPGVGDSLQLLLRRLQHLPALADCSSDALLAQAADAASLAGTDTRSALVQGVLHSQAGIIAHARAMALDSGWRSCRVVLTGGDAQRLLPLPGIAAEWQPRLLFIGMQWLPLQAAQT
mgnify:CR=1 FL=1